jgi:hypothetical protein
MRWESLIGQISGQVIHQRANGLIADFRPVPSAAATVTLPDAA